MMISESDLSWTSSPTLSPASSIISSESTDVNLIRGPHHQRKLLPMATSSTACRIIACDGDQSLNTDAWLASHVEPASFSTSPTSSVESHFLSLDTTLVPGGFRSGSLRSMTSEADEVGQSGDEHLFNDDWSLLPLTTVHQVDDTMSPDISSLISVTDSISDELMKEVQPSGIVVARSASNLAHFTDNQDEDMTRLIAVAPSNLTGQYFLYKSYAPTQATQAPSPPENKTQPGLHTMAEAETKACGGGGGKSSSSRTRRTAGNQKPGSKRQRSDGSQSKLVGPASDNDSRSAIAVVTPIDPVGSDKPVMMSHRSAISYRPTKLATSHIQVVAPGSSTLLTVQDKVPSHVATKSVQVNQVTAGGQLVTSSTSTSSSLASTSSTTTSSAATTSSCHICQICHKKFKDRYSVNVHVRTHTGEKPFSCVHCSKRFRQKAHLAKHMHTHASSSTSLGVGGNANNTNNGPVSTNNVQAGAVSAMRTTSVSTTESMTAEMAFTKFNTNSHSSSNGQQQSLVDHLTPFTYQTSSANHHNQSVAGAVAVNSNLLQPCKMVRLTGGTTALDRRPFVTLASSNSAGRIRSTALLATFEPQSSIKIEMAQ